MIFRVWRAKYATSYPEYILRLFNNYKQLKSLLLLVLWCCYNTLTFILNSLLQAFWVKTFLLKHIQYYDLRRSSRAVDVHKWKYYTGGDCNKARQSVYEKKSDVTKSLSLKFFSINKRQGFNIFLNRLIRRFKLMTIIVLPFSKSYMVVTDFESEHLKCLFNVTVF